MRILSKVSVIFILSVFTFYTSLAQKSTVIPQPLFVEDADGECLISKNTAIITDIENKGNATSFCITMPKLGKHHCKFCCI